jgi:iron complex outermembrane recepter protein
MDNLLQKLMLGGSTAALFAAMPSAVFAQGSDIEQVVVSASRIQIAGYQQPTPVSVVGAAQLLEAANADIGDTLRAMPSMGIASTPEKGSNGNAGNSGALGVSGINLDNLGANRNLILLDGQRLVSPILSGGVDLSVIPSTIIQRVDVVTGGASAAWGSDAISGVVNLVLNKNFSGLKASIDLQDTGQDTRRSYGFTVTNGFDMFGGRSHVEWAVTYNDSPETVFESSAHWFNAPDLIANPLYVAGNHAVPQLIHVNNSAQRDVPGGDITTGPLAGIQFGPGGLLSTFTVPQCGYYLSAATAPFIASTVSNSTSACYGGSGNQTTNGAQLGLLSFPLQQGTGFFYGTYKITPDIQASLMLNYGYNRSHSSSLIVDSSATIKTDNAYLNPTLLAAIKSDGLTSVTVSVNGTDGDNIQNPGDIANFGNASGLPVTQTVRQFYRAVFTLDGAIGDNWSWSAYYQHSESHAYEVYHSIIINGNFANAVDAVTVTAANAGKTGFVPGTIACRSTLTNPTNGCSPLDVMGTGVGSVAGLNYIEDHNDFYRTNIEQDTAGASMQGVLPWDLIGAGAPSTAFGVEYRKEAAVATSDPLGQAGLLGGGNLEPVRGQFNVIEGFTELDIPIIKNGIVESLDGNMAGRMTSYSTSGLVETWKLGLTSQINDDVRLRFTMSYDIRAPNLGELFNTITASGGQVDYKTQNNVTSALSFAAGNPNLIPEKSTTYSGGIVLTPHWVPGLTMSFDWYSISVKGIIVAPSTTQERSFCLANTPTPAGGNYCTDWIYSPALATPGSAANPNGLNFVYSYPFNNGFLTTSGLDFVADYAMDFMGGNLAWHLLGNYNDEETESVFGVTNANGTPTTFDFAGSMSGASQFAGVPKTHMTLSATYTEGPWSGTVQSRYIGTAKLVNGWTSGVQVDDNRVAQIAYLDLRGTYRWNDNIQFYLSIDNVFDTPPPVTVSYNVSTNGVSTTNSSVYDTLGRMWHTGVRFSF